MATNWQWCPVASHWRKVIREEMGAQASHLYRQSLAQLVGPAFGFVRFGLASNSTQGTSARS